VTAVVESTAVELLPLPRLSLLDASRREGAACVWCGGTPSADLGPRTGVALTALPRACVPCVAREAQRVYGVHARQCRRCGTGTYCPDGRALCALMNQQGGSA
jgi:hypothetical protein